VLDRLFGYWVYGGFLSGLLLLLLTPVLIDSWPVALAATFLCLPAYMLHQYEEHDNDRFRLFVNKAIGGKKEALSPAAVFVINVPGVWGVVGVSILLAAKVEIGYGLIAAYLLVVNAIVHIAHAIVFRSYNPGLATAIAFFLPLGSFTIRAIDHVGGGTLPMHLKGAAIAIGIHGAIIIYALSRSRRHSY
jgi:hypothetical protein